MKNDCNLIDDRRNNLKIFSNISITNKKNRSHKNTIQLLLKHHKKKIKQKNQTKTIKQHKLDVLIKNLNLYLIMMYNIRIYRYFKSFFFVKIQFYVNLQMILLYHYDLNKHHDHFHDYYYY